MRIGIIGGGTIARMFLEHAGRGQLGDASIVGILGRSPQSRGVPLAAQFRVPHFVDLDALIAAGPEVVVEAASHDAVRDHTERLLRNRITVIVLSGGALADDRLRDRLEAAAKASGALLYVPSGGIGALDAIKAAVVAGVDEVGIRAAKPPRAWKGIPYVESLGVDLDALTEPFIIYDGPARAGVAHFPQNVNIAAVLSMAGVGFDRTRLTVVADPGIARNTHVITARGVTGNISITLENVPAPDNPKTAWLACYSALAAVRELQSPARYGT